MNAVEGNEPEKNTNENAALCNKRPWIEDSLIGEGSKKAIREYALGKFDSARDAALKKCIDHITKISET